MSGTRAGIYTRISVDRDGDKAGPARQEADCRRAAKQHGLKVAGVYTDRDASAYTTGAKRPEWERLMADVDAGRIDVVLAWTVDRFHRNRDDWYRAGTLVDRGFRLIFDRDGIDTSTEYGAERYDDKAQEARAESRRISMRVKRAFEDRARAGKPHWTGGRCFGYDERHRIVAREAKAVRRAVAVILSGGSLGQVARELNAAGVTTTRGNAWSSAQVGQMLRRPTIAGLRTHHGTLYAGTWQPIVDPDTWRRVVATLKVNRPKGGGRRANLLTGLARCDACPNGMTSQLTGKGVRRYVCAPASGGCGKRGILAAGLEAHVVDHVLTALDGPGLRRMLRGGNAKQDRSTQVELEQAEADLRQLTEDHHVLKLVPRAAYVDAARELTARIERLSAAQAVDTNRAVLATLPAVNLRGWWDQADLHARRAVLDAVLTDVLVGPVKRGGAGWDPDRVKLVWRA